MVEDGKESPPPSPPAAVSLCWSSCCPSIPALPQTYLNGTRQCLDPSARLTHPISVSCASALRSQQCAIKNTQIWCWFCRWWVTINSCQQSATRKQVTHTVGVCSPRHKQLLAEEALRFASDLCLETVGLNTGNGNELALRKPS